MIDIIVFLICTLCGYVIGKYIERQVRAKAAFFADASRYVSLFGINIDGRQLDVTAFNKEFVENCSESFANFLQIRNAPWRLSNAEKQQLRWIYEGLGAMSSDELKKQLDFRSVFIAEQNKKYSEQASKASVYPKLGVLLGAMAGILFI